MKNESIRHSKLHFWSEILGMSPWKTRWQQTKIALMGEEDVPKTKFGWSSLAQYHPRISPKLWLGKPYRVRKVIISNLVNHTPTPIEEGWSVKKTQVRDYRGKKLTYDSHNGTDFAIPVGSTVCAAAAGKVVEIRSEFNRGGLKVFIDHGMGLMTCYAHLARPLVAIGDYLQAGQAFALSGYSGRDALITLPFGIRHIHFNVLLNCAPTDPFPYGQKSSMWRNAAMPLPAKPETTTIKLSAYSEAGVQQQINYCRTAKVKANLQNLEGLEKRAVHTIIQKNYYPTRFSESCNVYDQTYPRRAVLNLPFSPEEFDDCIFLDEL